MRYRSQDVFRVGSSCLPNSRAISSARYSGYPESPTVYLYGAVTLCGRPFQTEFEFTSTEYPGPKHHISHRFPGGIRFALRRFRSPLLAASRLISFPPLTKMLQFGGCPTLTGHMGLPMSEVLFGHPRIKGSLRLHEAFRSLARPSSAPEPSHSPDDYKSPKRQFDRRPALRMSRRSSTSGHGGPNLASAPLPRRAYVPSACSPGARSLRGFSAGGKHLCKI